jgi:hypothetical protein
MRIVSKDGYLNHIFDIQFAGVDGAWFSSVTESDEEASSRAMVFIPRDAIREIGNVFREIDGPRFDNDPRQQDLAL